MKTFWHHRSLLLRTMGIGGFIAVLVVAGCKSTYQTSNIAFKAVKYENSFERGRNLTYNVCGQCHYDRETGWFIGQDMKDLPKFIGTVYSDNITNHATKGIAYYTDAELKYLLKTGINREGKFIPYMVRPTMANRDINDIIVYLRSGDAPVAAKDTSIGETDYSFLGNLALKVGGKPTPYIEDTKAPDPNDQIAYGGYLIDIVGCYHCHSKSITGLDYVNPEESKGYMAGGMKFKVDGEKVFASNLTPDKATGIGHYSKEDFRKAVRDKIAPDGSHLKYPMRKFPHLSDQQVDAMYAYIMQLPPKDNKVKGQVQHTASAR